MTAIITPEDLRDYAASINHYSPPSGPEVRRLLRAAADRIEAQERHLPTTDGLANALGRAMFGDDYEPSHAWRDKATAILDALGNGSDRA